MLIVWGFGAAIAVVAVVLIVAMAMPPSRQEHTQSVLGVIPQTVLAWRARAGAPLATHAPETTKSVEAEPEVVARDLS